MEPPSRISVPKRLGRVKNMFRTEQQLKLKFGSNLENPLKCYLNIEAKEQ